MCTALTHYTYYTYQAFLGMSYYTCYAYQAFLGMHDTYYPYFTCYTYQAFLGMYVVAIGAEIPDTIQSVAVARRGYGAMDGCHSYLR